MPVGVYVYMRCMPVGVYVYMRCMPVGVYVYMRCMPVGVYVYMRCMPVGVYVYICIYMAAFSRCSPSPPVFHRGLRIFRVQLAHGCGFWIVVFDQGNVNEQ